MTEQPSADDRRPPGLTDEEWSALSRWGGAIRRGRQYENDEPVHEIRWPNGAVTDLRRTTPLATGGFVKFDPASAIRFEHSCWAGRPKPGPLPEGVTITMNFELGFTGELSPSAAEAIRGMTAGMPVDPRVDEEWDAWRCPGCGRSHDKVGAGHAWQVDGAGNASRNGVGAA